MKAFYKGKTIGFEIVANRLCDKIIFQSIGVESNRFMKAIAELYDESSLDEKMQERIPAFM